MSADRVELLQSIGDALSWCRSDEYMEFMRDVLAGRVDHKSRPDLSLLRQKPPLQRLHEVVSTFGVEKVVGEMGYDFFAFLTKYFIDRGRPLPPMCADFVSGVLDGTIVRKNRGPRRFENMQRDVMIAELVEWAVQQGMTPYRNDASDANSACDLVSMGLKETCTADLDYKSVASIYRKVVNQINGSIPEIPEN